MVAVGEKHRPVARVGDKPITVGPGVEVSIAEGNQVKVKGPKGELTQTFHPQLIISLEEGVLRVDRPSEHRSFKALHGLTRALLSNMVVGVTDGFEKALDLVGTGYRVQQAGAGVMFQVGFSHNVDIDPLDGVELTVLSPTRVLVSGCDKQRVGQMAATMRAVRPPDHYKGKGIRYAGEVVRLKPGKAAARK
jgi:large subunit ribosomal protein L6